MENPVDQFRRDFESHLEATTEARANAERDRDYADLKQWTDEEAATIKARKQAPVTFDYCREQLDYLLGMERDHRADPKAYPRSKEHAEAASAATDAIRYVCDSEDFQNTASECFDNLLVEGIEIAMVEAEESKKNGFDVKIRGIPWDRFYFDPHSRKRDFSDAQFLGIVAWLDVPDAVRMYRKQRRGLAGEINDLMKGEAIADGSTYDDKPLWADTKRKRIRVCQHYYLKDGEWWVCHFSGDLVLVEPQPSSYVDEDGNPDCPIVAMSAYVDRNNMRYGYLRRLIDPQNEVNHRRSKSLFLLSARQVLAEEGAVLDQSDAQRELKKPDGWVNLTPGSLSNGSIQISQTGDMAQGQLAMYQDAIAKMQSTGSNAALQGDVEGMSGRAIQRAQMGGSIQIGPLFDAHKHWRKRVYRKAWARIKQFWDAPMWIRVTDNEDDLKWVGLNQPVTVGQQLQEAAEAGDQRAAQMLQAAMQAGDPELNNVVDTRNQVAEMDVDIILDEGPDTLTSHEEQFKVMAELAKAYGPEKVPFEVLLELSAIPHKRQVKELLAGDKEQGAMQAQMAQMQQQMAQMQQQMQMALGKARIDKEQAQARAADADAQLTQARVEQTQVETAILVAVPDPSPNINI